MRKKPLTKRTPRDEAAIRVRLLDGLHTQDVIDRCVSEFGARGRKLGPIDLSRNPLVSDGVRRGKAYSIPPAVTGLGPDLAYLIGDASAATTIQRYGLIGARPMPTAMVSVSADALRYRLGCNWVGVAIGWSERSMRPFLEVVTPDCLDVTYASDDPLSPTVIRRLRETSDGKELWEVYDLTDLDHPSLRIESEAVDPRGVRTRTDVTGDVLGDAADADYWWRYEDGRPFHRIIISGDPRQPYRGLPLVEGTLRITSGYTAWWAGMRDAAFPSRHAIGLELDGLASITGEGEGQDSGPEIVHVWRHSNPDKPGTLIQLGPGYDPEVTGRALRTYEVGLLRASGLPVNLESTGGAPSQDEGEEIEEQIEATYPECRGQDTLLLRRLAAVCNRAREAYPDEDIPGPITENGYGVLYRAEVRQALAAKEQKVKEEPVKQGEEENGNEDDPEETE